MLDMNAVSVCIVVMICRQQNPQYWRHSKGPALSIEISLLLLFFCVSLVFFPALCSITEAGVYE